MKWSIVQIVPEDLVKFNEGYQARAFVLVDEQPQIANVVKLADGLTYLVDKDKKKDVLSVQLTDPAQDENTIVLGPSYSMQAVEAYKQGKTYVVYRSSGIRQENGDPMTLKEQIAKGLAKTVEIKLTLKEGAIGNKPSDYNVVVMGNSIKTIGEGIKF